MPELQFKGKEFVYNHQLTVSFQPLEMHADKGAPRLDGNLIIHDENLQALKALLPTHAGKVDYVFIDPPYNTGKEGWPYAWRASPGAPKGNRNAWKHGARFASTMQSAEWSRE